MTKIEIPEWGESRRGGTNLYVPYNEDFIEALKETVPSRLRRYEPGDVPCWWIHDNWLDEVESLLVEHFPDYES